jgi:hypothetical protein
MLTRKAASMTLAPGQSAAMISVFVYQTMGISDKKTGHGEGLRSENNLFRAAQEGLVRRVEDEGIK